jgi:hypothetical protein
MEKVNRISAFHLFLLLLPKSSFGEHNFEGGTKDEMLIFDLPLLGVCRDRRRTTCLNLCIPNEDFGRMNKDKMRILSDFSMVRSPDRAAFTPVKRTSNDSYGFCKRPTTALTL